MHSVLHFLCPADRWDNELFKNLICVQVAYNRGSYNFMEKLWIKVLILAVADFILFVKHARLALKKACYLKKSHEIEDRF